MIYQYGSQGCFHDNGAYRYWILCKQLIKTLCALLLRYSNSLQAVWYGDWIALWSQNLRTRPDWPWVPPHLLYNEYQLPFPGLKRMGCDIHHPPYSSAEVKEIVELYLYSPLGLSGLFRLNFIFILLGLVYLITVFFDNARVIYTKKV